MGDDHIEPERLSLSVVRSLRWIILVSLLGIVALSAWGLALKYGFVGDGQEETADSADEALSILGNIGSAAVGGLVGFLTRDLVLKIEQAGRIRDTDTPLVLPQKGDADDGDKR